MILEEHANMIFKSSEPGVGGEREREEGREGEIQEKEGKKPRMELTQKNPHFLELTEKWNPITMYQILFNLQFAKS